MSYQKSESCKLISVILCALLLKRDSQGSFLFYLKEKQTKSFGEDSAPFPVTKQGFLSYSFKFSTVTEETPFL